MVLQKESAKSFIIYFVVAVFALLVVKCVLLLMGIDLRVPVFEPFLQWVINTMRNWAEYTKQFINT